MYNTTEDNYRTVFTEVTRAGAFGTHLVMVNLLYRCMAQTAVSLSTTVELLHNLKRSLSKPSSASAGGTSTTTFLSSLYVFLICGMYSAIHIARQHLWMCFAQMGDIEQGAKLQRREGEVSH